MVLPADFFEIDFLAVETAKSGDAIAIRSSISNHLQLSLVDGGFTDMGEKIVNFIEKYYSNPAYLHNVVLTHPDGDHARGLKFVLENCAVEKLWMNRPWLYAGELIARFKTFNSVAALESRLRQSYPNVAALEDIAISKGIPIYEAFQGEAIGHFTVMSPTREKFLSLVVDSDKTPDAIEKSAFDQMMEQMSKSVAAAAKAVVSLISSAWGEERFSTSATSCENEMSVVQFAEIGGKKILLTGDAGRDSLAEVVAFAPWIGLRLPGIDRFQVPHHGSRRNVSTEMLDKILGPRFRSHSDAPERAFTALISSALADPDHPRKAVERAMRHRGGFVVATEGQDVRTSWNAPDRAGYSPVSARPYPTEQED